MKQYWNTMSLKARLTLVMACTGILLILGCLGGIAYMAFQQYLPALSQNQQTLLSELADGIDNQLRMSLQALDRVARITPVRTTVDPATAQRFLENRTGIMSFFDNGLALFDRNGRLMAETPVDTARTVFDFSTAPFFIQAKKADSPIISVPFRSTKPDHHPVIQFCAPIRNGSGMTIGFLTGGLRLDSTNFVGNLANRRISKTGYLFIYDKARTILIHPDQDRILKQDVPAGVNHLFDKALTGWNGSGVTTNSRGLRMYASFKSLSEAPWIIGANIPASEVAAPVLTGASLLFALILLLGLGGGALSRLLIHRLTKPLADFSQHLQMLPQLEGDGRFIQPTGEPELLTVASSLNLMLKKQDEHLELISRQMADLEVSAQKFENTMHLLRMVTDTVPDLIWAKNLDGEYLFVNQATCDKLLCAADTDEPIGKTDLFFAERERREHPDRDDWHTFGELCCNSDTIVLEQGFTQQFEEFGNVRGELLCLEVIKGLLQDADGRLLGTVGCGRDVTEERAYQKKVEYLSWNDPLTDLPNRQMFNLYLTQAIARAQRGNHIVAVLLIDLDYFKDINDSFGHATGDALLVGVASRLRERLRATDQVARLGGDEFAVLLEQEESLESIAAVAQSIMVLIRSPFQLDDGVQLHIDISIGITLFPDHGQTAQELLQRADTTLYKAKQQGRAAFAFYSNELTERAVERIYLSNRLRRAVELAELRVVYQPQVDLVSDRITGAEALMRWENPDIGTVSPARFIPLAEELGCIVGMGEWMLREVCRQGRAWLDAGLPAMSLAVNISAVQFRQASFTQQVATILAETGYPPELLELELTESGLIQLGEQSVQLLQNLRGLGLRLALDDFGTGYSSLAYLKHFPLHVVKIDKSFVDEIHVDVKDKQLVETIVFMSKGMNFKVLAEGVELSQQMETLKNLRCDLYQGYLKSRPLPPETFEELVRNEQDQAHRAPVGQTSSESGYQIMHTTTPETCFAPAGRSDEALLYAERSIILDSPMLVAVIDAMPDFVVILNQHRQIVGINKKLMQSFGISHAVQLLGKRPGEALGCIHCKEGPDGCGTSEHCSVCGAVLAILASQNSHETATGECRLTLHNNGLISLDLEVMASPLDIAGETFTIFALKDISADKRRNVLERVFFHDILNTAGGIRGVASLIVDGVSTEDEEEYKHWLLSLSENLIDDINHQRRLLAAERGEYEPVLEETDIHELLDDVRRLYENHVKTPDRTVVLGTVEHYVVTTDRALLRRVVGNMVFNALEASSPDSVVTIDSIKLDQGLRIEVTNTGEMPQEVQLQVFKRSFSTKGTDGRGIGTYSMKLFGEKYLKGKVGFSCRNGSTSFYITIPW